MATSIKGTQTEKNLLIAFAGESQAKNRYTFFAKVARKEGFEQISEIFEKTAQQEEQHAKTLFRFLEGGMVSITATYPAGVIGDTAQNLEAAAEGEHEEWADMYPKFAEIAELEGFPKIAATLKLIAKVEQEHEERYRKLYRRLKGESVFSREEKTEWQCRKCGFVHKGKKAPAACPICGHPTGFFEEKAVNY